MVCNKGTLNVEHGASPHLLVYPKKVEVQEGQVTFDEFWPKIHNLQIANDANI